MKLVVLEAESAALLQHIQTDGEDQFMVSELVSTELWRGIRRNGGNPGDLSRVLDHFDVVDVSRAALRTAGQLDGRHLRSLDAIHIAVALENEVRSVLTYDDRQADSAVRHGLLVESPGMVQD